jgi:hypothetical protein
LHLLMREFMNAICEVSAEYLIHDMATITQHANIENLFTSTCESVRCLVAAGSDINARNFKGSTPLHELINGMMEHSKKIYEISHEEFNEVFKQMLFPPRNELAPIIVELIKCGARSWEVVPEPCFGIEKALMEVWWDRSTIDLRCFFEKLEPGLKTRLKTGLLCSTAACRERLICRCRS